jgi:hypothetical protein
MIRTTLVILGSMFFTLVGIGVFLRTVFKTLESVDSEDGF